MAIFIMLSLPPAGAGPEPLATWRRRRHSPYSWPGQVLSWSRERSRAWRPNETRHTVNAASDFVHRGQAARRRTSQMVAAMSSADSTSSQPPSMHWNGQNRLAGW
jgi:hypothetical protein